MIHGEVLMGDQLRVLVIDFLTGLISEARGKVGGIAFEVLLVRREPDICYIHVYLTIPLDIRYSKMVTLFF